MRVLVIGGAGFVGSHVVAHLCRTDVREIVVLDSLVAGRRENLRASLEDPRVRLVEGDIRDRALLAEQMRGMDAVLHLAALWLWECEHHPRAALEVNVEGTFNVAEAAVEAGVRRVVLDRKSVV